MVVGDPVVEGDARGDFFGGPAAGEVDVYGEDLVEDGEDGEEEDGEVDDGVDVKGGGGEGELAGLEVGGQVGEVGAVLEGFVAIVILGAFDGQRVGKRG